MATEQVGAPAPVQDGIVGEIAKAGPPGASAPPPREVERRSVDWVPDEERTGKVAHLGFVWFAGNINLTAMATGVTALTFGGSLFWTIVATVLGSLFGTFFMAFHSAQGPQLGLPQLVQSRAQFGYLGAALTVWVFALANYVAYNTTDAILSGSAMDSLVGIPTDYGFPLAALIAGVLAVAGYHWIHRAFRWVTWPLVVVMIALTVAALANSGLEAGAFTPGALELAPFMTVFVIVAGFQLGWAPYVSDYSRYLPANVGVRSTFWWTYLPSALAGVWVFVLGAILAAGAPEGSAPVDAFRLAGDRLVDGLGAVAIFGLLIGLLTVMAVNAYGGSLSMLSIADSFKQIKPTRAKRVASIAVMTLVVWAIAQFVGEERFFEFYGNVLVFLAYVFTPWTAINLVDYFFVRRGIYSIREIFNPNGMYGRWGWRGNLAYAVGLGTMVPFFVTTPYVGPLAEELGSVDLSLFVGLPVSALLYLALTRNLDLRHERAVAEAEGVLPTVHP